MSEHTASPDGRVRVYVLGTLHLERRMPDGRWEDVPTTSEEWGSGHPTRSFLRYLLAHGRCVGRGTILDTLWTDVDSADRYLYNAASTLRRILRSDEQAPLLETIYNRTTYKLAGQSRVWVDVDHATNLLQDVKRSGPTSEHGLRLLQEAELLFRRGPLFADEPGDWCFGLREQTRTMQYRCQLWLAEAYEAHQQLAEAEIVVEALLTQDPTDERALRHLMTLLHEQGLTSEAVRRYKQTTAFLKQKGLALSAEMEAHVQAIQHTSVVQGFSSPPAASTHLSALIREDQPPWLSGIDFAALMPTAPNVSSESLSAVAEPFKSREILQTRRQTLHYLLMIGSTALVLAPHAARSPHESEPFHLSILEELEMITASYWRLCTNTSLDLLGNLAEHFRTVVHLFQRPLPHATTQRLCSLSGEIAQILGKTLFDLQEYTLAHAYYLFSLKAAQSASNHDLWATGIGRLILLLIYWGRPQHALPLLQEVLQLDIQSTRIVCWLAVVEAEVHAHLGDGASCDAALKKAKNISERTLFGEDRYATGFSASRLAGYEGACFVRLHQPDRALLALQQALSLLDPQAIRRQSTLLTDMGIAYAQQGNIQKACQVALQVLSITRQTGSRAVLERVRLVRSELEAWKETTEVHDLEKHLDTTSALIAG